jgi:nucleoside-diphosphate-sugar epimerase
VECQRVRTADLSSVLITGGAGFIGSHLAEALIARDHEVYVLDDLSTGDLANLAPLRGHPRLHLVVDTVLHREVVSALVHKCDMVYHLAAAVGVRLIVDQPVHTITTNIRGTETMLEFCGRLEKRILIASTSEVYGDHRTTDPLREDARRVYGPTTVKRWAYAASKEVDEFLALAWHQEHGLDVVIARLFNIVGPRQSAEYGMVVPNFVRRALIDEPIEVHNGGAQTRSFCDVEDCVRALVALMEEPSANGEIYNVGNDVSVTIAQLAELVRERCDSSSEVITIPYEQAYGSGFEDMLHRRPSIEKISAATGWRPLIPLAEALDRVIATERAAARVAALQA